MTQPEQLLPVDRASPVPLYFQLAQQLESAIESGALPPGSQLENEIGLAARYGLSRPTIRQAIEYLVDRGLVVRRRGVGTQVVPTRVKRALELTSLYDDLAKSNQRPATKVLELAEQVAPDRVAQALHLPVGTQIVVLRRLRSAAGEPLALMNNYLPVGLVELGADELERRGLYEILRSAGLNLRVATQTVGAKSASGPEAKALGENKGAALLTMSRTTYDDGGRAVEYGSHVYRASLYSFEFTLVSR